MNQVIENILNRRSTRIFNEEKVDVEILKEIVKAGLHAPSSKNKQLWHFTVIQNKDVLGVDLLQTRIFGNKIYVDVEIEVNASYPLREAHNIAECVHNDIEKTFPKVKHIMVHVNPKEVEES